MFNSFFITVVVFLLIFLAILIGIAINISKAAKNIKVGDVFEMNEYVCENEGHQYNLCARVVEVFFDENDVKTVRYILYTRGELGGEEKIMDAFSFVAKFEKI